jgi:putative Ca2+/H+ antiporter (TMEM165/GDT1 family)
VSASCTVVHVCRHYGLLSVLSGSTVLVLEPVVYSIKFASAFLASISMIIVSEFGDKTFFIAAIMAMRNNRLEGECARGQREMSAANTVELVADSFLCVPSITCSSSVFSSAIAALALMTVLSAAMGQTLPAILDPRLTHYMATALFFFFGAKLLHDAYQMDGAGDLKEELDEVEEELQAKELAESGGVELLPGGVSSRVPATRRFLAACTRFFRLTFLAEWGDRSQIATIALAAQKDAFGVTAGGIIGHALCTGVAVLGGKLLATRISERTILLSGGVLFLIFGLHSVYFGEEH